MTPPSQSSVDKAKEIIEGLIEYDQWRDNLHVNDFAWTKQAIASALDQESRKVEELRKLFIETAKSDHRKLTDQIIDTAHEQTKNQTLTAQLKEAVEVIEFYADHDSLIHGFNSGSGSYYVKNEYHDTAKSFLNKLEKK